MSMSAGSAPSMGMDVGFGGSGPGAAQAAAGFGRTTSLAPGIVSGEKANIRLNF